MAIFALIIGRLVGSAALAVLVGHCISFGMGDEDDSDQ